MSTCPNCRLSFTAPWCDQGHCLFCVRYLPMRDEYSNILADALDCYLTSGWTDEAAYYRQHIEYLVAWCAKWHIRATTEDLVVQEGLFKWVNWTREY